MMLRQISALCLLSGVFLVHGRDEIRIKIVNSYTKIWTDRGSGADEDGSFWRPVDHLTGFYALGDSATNSHSRPTTAAVMVQECRRGALKAPESFTFIWNDRGSGADKDVSVYRMNPAPGYTCLGSVAVNSYNTLPSTSNYRCVNNNYLTYGVYQPIWDDQGSGADRDVSLWRVYASRDYSGGISANTFVARAFYNMPPGRPKVLDSTHTVIAAMLPR